ncbi:MAG: hypothetical protein K1X94_08535, partial [Sandaracinaceae bacterium]|nr:hypothetical protein [Sandaracinaceae bacterium]
KTAAATGPRYFLAASEDWTGAPERVSRAQATTPGPATPLGSSAANSSTSLPRLAPPPERPTAEAPIPPARDSAPKPAREEVSVKGALVVALLDHLETELGSATASLTIGSIEPQLRAKLEGVILPMAWLPLGLFEALLGAVDRDHPESTRAGAAGRAAAERELSTTHRLFLQTATPASVLEHLPHLHRVYFSKGEAKVVAATVGTKVELDGLGVESPGLVAWLAGFWQRMLELAGARDVKIVATTCRAHRDERSSVTLRWR